MAESIRGAASGEIGQVTAADTSSVAEADNGPNAEATVGTPGAPLGSSGPSGRSKPVSAVACAPNGECGAGDAVARRYRR